MISSISGTAFELSQRPTRSTCRADDIDRAGFVKKIIEEMMANGIPPNTFTMESLIVALANSGEGTGEIKRLSKAIWGIQLDDKAGIEQTKPPLIKKSSPLWPTDSTIFAVSTSLASLGDHKDALDFARQMSKTYGIAIPNSCWYSLLFLRTQTERKNGGRAKDIPYSAESLFRIIEKKNSSHLVPWSLWKLLICHLINRDRVSDATYFLGWYWKSHRQGDVLVPVKNDRRQSRMHSIGSILEEEPQASKESQEKVLEESRAFLKLITRNIRRRGLQKRLEGEEEWKIRERSRYFGKADELDLKWAQKFAKIETELLDNGIAELGIGIDGNEKWVDILKNVEENNLDNEDQVSLDAILNEKTNAMQI